MSKYRKLVNPENHQIIREGDDYFYLLAVDVGRLNCQSVVTVFKVYRGEIEFRMNLVNLYVIGKREEEKSFPHQTLELKRIIDRFNPAEVVVDANGLGIGFLDFLVQETPDLENGKVYPGYSSINLESHSQRLYPNTIPLIYGIKAGAVIQPQIDSNCYTKVFSGKVKFLVPEQDIKNRLMASKAGQLMKVEKRVARILPHEMTTRLFEEMCNLKLKGIGKDIKLERINSNILKDKFSSFEYGLWRIKEIEEDYYKKKRRKMSSSRQLYFIN